MRKKVVKMFCYILIALILSLIIYISPFNNKLIITNFYLIFSLYLMLNYYNNRKYPYLLQIYILWFLITIVYNMFTFSFFSIILSIIVLLLLTLQYKAVKTRYLHKKEKQIKSEEIIEKPKKESLVQLPEDFNAEQFETEIKKLYIDIQIAFMDFNYEFLNKTLSTKLYEQFEKQMNQLKNSGRKAVRENIEIFDFNIINGIFDDELIVKINIGVYETKYYQLLTEEVNTNNKPCYECYYEIDIKKTEDSWQVNSLKLLYSRSKRKKD